MIRFAARIAVGTSLVLSGASLREEAAVAQPSQPTLVLHGRSLRLSPVEMDRLSDVRLAFRAGRGVQDRALAAAEAAVSSADARYLLAVYQLEIGQQRQDDELRAGALDLLIASRDTPRDRLAGFIALRGAIAHRSRDYEMAASSWMRLLELQPNDPQTLFNLAQVRVAQNDPEGAAGLIRRAVAERQSGSESPPEIWYRQWLSLTYNAGLVEQGTAAAHALVAAYPTAENWRLALVAYRQLAAPAQGAEIDLLRLMRAVDALVQPAEFQRLAQLLLHAGLPFEAKAVLDEGIARGIVSRTEYPTPEIVAEIDRAPAPQSGNAALQQGGVDIAASNTRLAMAMALAGQRSEAASVFRAVAENRDARWYADLARFWLTWLGEAG